MADSSELGQLEELTNATPTIIKQVPRTAPPLRDPTFLYMSLYGSGGRSHFLPSEYDLKEIGRIEDSVHGSRFTAVKVDGQLRVCTFSELFRLAETRPCQAKSFQDGREYIVLPEGLEALSGEVAGGRVVGVWKPVNYLTRHRVTKDGCVYLQKHGSTEVTLDHSLITMDDSELVEFKPLEERPLAKIVDLSEVFWGSVTKVDLAQYFPTESDVYQIYSDRIVYTYRAGLSNGGHDDRVCSIPRYIEEDQLEDFCALLGAYVSEGSVKLRSDGHYTAFRISSTSFDWLSSLSVKFSDVFGLHAPIVATSDADYAISVPKILVSDLFGNMAGYRSENKKLPDFVYQLPLSAVQQLKDFMLDGDGNRQSYGYSYCTKSLALASGWSFLLRLEGVNHTFNYRFNHGRHYYSIRTNFGFEKPSQCKTWTVPVSYEDEWVYDLEVKDTHNFVDLAGQVLLHNTESYVAQAFKKQTGLMFKEGWGLTGPNPKTVRYIKKRFQQMEQVSGVSVHKLLRRLGSALVKQSNAFAIKVRKTEASGGRVRVASRKTLQPVAAYFLAPPESMQYRLDKNGKRVVRWEHSVDRSKKQEFRVEDVVHIKFNCKEGFIFGTPTVIPVMDDIRALRKIEENIELLIYQHIFPLFHYKVGTDDYPAGYTEDGYNEIEIARQEVREMPSEGGVITDHRHEIKLLGVEGRALRAGEYLEHFKKRVFAGLGVSAVDMGEGETANRATADNMSRNLIDAVKDFQDVLASAFNELIIKELLLESDFKDIDPLDEENMVYLEFHEIDIDAKIKKDNHYADLFQKNAISHDEMRMGMGLEPMELPTREEAQNGTDTSEKYPIWHRTFWKLFEEPKMLIQALDEPWSVEARVAASSRSLDLGQAEIEGEKSEQEKIRKEEQQTKAVDKKTAKKTKDFADLERESPSPMISIVRRRYDQAADLTIAAILSGQKDPEWLGAKIRAVFEPSKESLLVQMIGRFYNGYMSVNPSSAGYRNSLSVKRQHLRHRAEAYIQRLTDDLVRQVGRQVDRNGDMSTNDLAIAVRTVFDTLRYRANYIDETEMRAAFVLGQSAGYDDLGVEEVRVIAQPAACPVCQGHALKVVATDAMGLADLPPFHPNCRCGIERI